MNTYDEGWQPVKVDEGLEFPIEETSTLAIVRDVDLKVVALFPRGTNQRDVNEIVQKIPGVSMWVVKIRARYEVQGIGKKLGERKAKIREA